MTIGDGQGAPIGVERGHRTRVVRNVSNTRPARLVARLLATGRPVDSQCERRYPSMLQELELWVDRGLERRAGLEVRLCRDPADLGAFARYTRFFAPSPRKARTV